MTRLPQPVRCLGWASFFTDLASEMMYPLIPYFLTTLLGANLQLVGIYEGASEGIANISKYFFGKVADRHPLLGKAFVAMGYGISNALRPFIGLAANPFIAMALRFTDRIGKGLRSPARDLWLSRSARGDRGKIFGHQRAMDHAGAAVGPLVASGFLLVWPEHIREMFLATLVPGLIAVLFVILARSGAEEELDANKSLKIVSTESLTTRTDTSDQGNFRRYVICLFIFTLGNSSDAFLLLALQRHGLSVAMIPVVWFALHAIKSAASKPAGSLADKFGRRRLITYGWIIYTAVYAVFASTTSLAILLPAFLFYGLFYALTESSEKAMVADLIPLEGRGAAYGVVSLSGGVSALLASLLAGAIGDHWGLPTAFAFGASCAGVGLVALKFFVSPEGPPTPDHPLARV